jgi:uncharacterized membrane protein YdbT with pleckstrin-like domain
MRKFFVYIGQLALMVPFVVAIVFGLVHLALNDPTNVEVMAKDRKEAVAAENRIAFEKAAAVEYEARKAAARAAEAEQAEQEARQTAEEVRISF